MSYAEYRSAVGKAGDLRAQFEQLRAQLEQAESAVAATLPFLGDDIFVLIAVELDLRMLGRLACAAQRFHRKSVPNPEHKGVGAPELWSVAEEGARRQVRAKSSALQARVARHQGEPCWLMVLREAILLERPLPPRLDPITLMGGPGTSVSGVTMRVGVHAARFTVTQRGAGSYMSIGVVRWVPPFPFWNQPVEKAMHTGPTTCLRNGSLPAIATRAGR
eukprot:COSAG04_NODE_9402_length_867_cov_1.320312_1_plen_218_part_10